MPLLGGPALAPWCAEQRPDLVLVQETHLDNGGTASMIQQMGPLLVIVFTLRTSRPDGQRRHLRGIGNFLQESS